MKTGKTVSELGLYSSECCGAELIFDAGDTFSRCPACQHLCEWELEEKLVAVGDLERSDEIAA